MDPSQKALEDFHQLPADLQDRIRTEGRDIGDRVASHVTQILIGPRGNAADPKQINHASSVAVFTGRQTVLATAAHVIDKYRSRMASETNIAFQCGNLALDPMERLLWCDKQRDIALLHLEQNEQRQLPGMTWTVSSWPPHAPQIGDYVAFAGYPDEYRKNTGPGQVHLNLVGGMMAVTSCPGDTIKCVMPRASLVPIIGDHIPAAASQHGGMSGGPVFHVDGSSFELVGVITDFGSNFDMFWMGALAGIQLQ
jgi:hypothetical protein